MPAAATDTGTLALTFTPASGGDLSFVRVANAGAFRGDDFYVEGAEIVLCASACGAVRAEPTLSLVATFGG